MDSRKKRFSVLAVVFVITAIIFFIRLKGSDLIGGASKDSSISYTDAKDGFDKSKLPIIYIDTLGRSMNVLYGYTKGTDAYTAVDTLTILPDDNRLTIHTRGGSTDVIGASYEVRTLDKEELIEKTDVSQMQTTDAGVDIVLPIQKLLKEDTEYLLDIILKLSDYDKVHYYTTIKKADVEKASYIIELADTFSKNNFDYDLARANATYIETDGTADEQTLGDVSLKSTYDQLTYNSMELEAFGFRDIRLCAFDGNMGEVKIVSYARQKDAANKIYRIVEAMSYRQGAERFYMMDYKRSMSELVSGDSISCVDGSIDLGIQPEDTSIAIKDASGSFYAIASGGYLGVYSSAKKELTDVCKYNIDDIEKRDSFNRYNIKPLSIDSEGNLYFISYGYTNTGAYEGSVGITLMYYNYEENVLTQRAYIPADTSYENLREDVEKLAYLSDSNTLYLKLGSSIYALIADSGEHMVVCTGLSDSSYALTDDKFSKKLLAWQEGTDSRGSELIHMMDLNTGDKKELHADSGIIYKLLGFMREDIVVGIADKGNERLLHGSILDIPYNTIKILDDNLQTQMDYIQDGRYISDVYVGEDSASLRLLIKNSDGAFSIDRKDLIVNRDGDVNYSKSFAQLKQQVTDKSYELKHTMLEIKAAINKKRAASYMENEDKRLIELEEKLSDADRFIAYGHGDMIGSYENISDAINNAYESMGYVRFSGVIIYSRPATVSAKLIRNPENYAGEIMAKHNEGSLQSIRGTYFRPMLYYVGKGYPVLSFAQDGSPILIYGYDAHTISVYDINTATYYNMDINEAQSMYDENYDDFSLTFTFAE